MKIKIAFIGLVLVLLSTHLWVYSRGLVDGKVNYQHSKNLKLTLDCAYSYGLWDGERLGYYEGRYYEKLQCIQELAKQKHTKKVHHGSKK
jgi:hypothetical protein